MTELMADTSERLERSSFGFWLYIMTDCVLFATLFAVFVVLRHNTVGGPSSEEIFSLPFVFVETLLLLTSSMTSGLMMVALRAKQHRAVMGWSLLTWALGAAFIAMELYEFRHLVQEDAAWHRSAFLSSFFTLVGTHGAHVLFGLLWLAILLWRIKKSGITENAVRKFTLFSMFWHFLDIIWIGIFTVVYLIGVVL